MKKKQKREKIRNFVAKHMFEFNKATVEESEKKKSKRGHRKHKKNWANEPSFCLFV